MGNLRLPLQQGKSRLSLLSVALLMVLLLSGVKGFSQAAINSTGAAADGSAMLDVSGTSKGVLINRMSASQMNSIGTPANGLIIFNTDCNALYYNAGTTGTPNWVPVNASNNTVAAPGTITGSASVCASATGVAFSIAAVAGATSYTWTLPTGASITSGAGTNSIVVTFGSTSGNVCVSAYVNSCQRSIANCFAVTVGSASGLSAGTVSAASICVGQSPSVSFSTPPSGGTDYAYQWYNGANVLAGATGNTYAPIGGASGIVSTESFDGVTFPPAGWASYDLVNTGGYSWVRLTAGLPAGGFSSYPDMAGLTMHSGAGMAEYDCWDAPNNDESILVSPSFSEAGNTTGASVSFWMYGTPHTNDPPDMLYVYYSTGASQPTDKSGAVLLASVSQVQAVTGWYQHTFSIPSSVTSSTVWLIFDVVSQYGTEIYLDDISWEANPLASYKAVVTSGCKIATTNSAGISFYATPGTEITGTTAICAGVATTLTASAGDTYAWSNGLSTQAITARYANTYTVTVTNTTSGCSAISSAVVSVSALESVTGLNGTITPTGINWYWTPVGDYYTSYYWNTTNSLSGGHLIYSPFPSYGMPPNTWYGQTLTPGCSDYTAYVYVFDNNNACVNSAPATATIKNSFITAPLAGTGSAGTTEITWSWSIVSGATSYLWNSVNNISTAANLGISLTAVQKGLSCGTPYTAYVWAYNICGTSAVTTLTATTKACNSAVFTCGNLLTDARDNYTYNTVQIGSQCWMANNLNYGEFVTAATTQAAAGTQKYCYENLISNCHTYGGLYFWGEAIDGVNADNTGALALGCNGTGPGAGFNPACSTPVQGICPAGWHVPSFFEWILLFQNAGDNPKDYAYNQNVNLGPTVDSTGYTNLLPTGSTGFNLLIGSGVGGGSWQYGTDYVWGGTDYIPGAEFITSSLVMQTNNSWYGSMVGFIEKFGPGWAPGLNSQGPVATYGNTTLVGPANGGFAQSVRCVAN